MNLRYRWLGFIAFATPFVFSGCISTGEPCHNYCGEVIELDTLHYLSTENTTVYRLLLKNQCSHNELEEYIYFNNLGKTAPPILGEVRCSTYVNQDRQLSYYIW